MQLPTQLPTRLPTRLNTIEDYYLATGGGGRLQPETRQAIARVQADGGVVEDPQWLNEIIGYWKSRGKWGNFVLLCGRGLGETIRISGSDRFVSRLWDASAYQGDYVQTSESLQGKIDGNKLDVTTNKNYVADKKTALTGATSVVGLGVAETRTPRASNSNLIFYGDSTSGPSRQFEIRQNNNATAVTIARRPDGESAFGSDNITIAHGQQILIGEASQTAGMRIQDANGVSSFNANNMGTLTDLTTGGFLFSNQSSGQPWNSTARVIALLRDTTLTADDRAGFIALCRAKYGDIVTAP
jgi:hypothetical protein